MMLIAHRSKIALTIQSTMTVAHMQAPLASYGILTGELFLYAAGRAAFETLPQSTKKCVLIGGLSDGLLPTPYTGKLSEACRSLGWSLVQPILSSSYLGFGHGTLERDCREIEEVLQHLIDARRAEQFCIIGHSTGCQDIVYFLKHADAKLCEKVKVAVLQAPVSDREGAELEDGFNEKLAIAQEMKAQGKAHEMMPRSAFWAPITAERFLDLSEKGGRDDFFSSDFADDELAERLSHVGDHTHLRMLVVNSGTDEFVPKHVDIVALTERIAAAMNTSCESTPVAKGFVLKTGNHNLQREDQDQKEFVDIVAESLKGL